MAIWNALSAIPVGQNLPMLTLPSGVIIAMACWNSPHSHDFPSKLILHGQSISNCHGNDTGDEVWCLAKPQMVPAPLLQTGANLLKEPRSHSAAGAWNIMA